MTYSEGLEKRGLEDALLRGYDDDTRTTLLASAREFVLFDLPVEYARFRKITDDERVTRSLTDFVALYGNIMTDVLGTVFAYIGSDRSSDAETVSNCMEHFSDTDVNDDLTRYGEYKESDVSQALTSAVLFQGATHDGIEDVRGFVRAFEDYDDTDASIANEVVFKFYWSRPPALTTYSQIFGREDFLESFRMFYDFDSDKCDYDVLAGSCSVLFGRAALDYDVESSLIVENPDIGSFSKALYEEVSEHMSKDASGKSASAALREHLKLYNFKMACIVELDKYIISIAEACAGELPDELSDELSDE